MGSLRDRLGLSAPTLRATLERCWDIALNQWLPAVGVQMDSFNSYPHLRNLEFHLERLVAAYESTKPDAEALFSPSELYVMLSAILFHDIGRLKCSTGHGEASRELIEHEYGVLGIESMELAYSIARICEFHDWNPADAEKEIWKLSTVVVDPYGRIRERALAALLMLIDHLDGAFTRVPPPYVRPPGEALSIGAFRNAVRGVEVDLLGQTVVVELSDRLDKSNRDEGSPDSIELNSKRLSSPICEAQVREDLRQDMLRWVREPDLWHAVFGARQAPKALELAIIRQLGFPQRKPAHSASEAPRYSITTLPQYQSDGHNPTEAESGSEEPFRLHVKPAQDEPERGWPAHTRLALLLGNTRENAEALKPIQSVLAALGMPVKKWLVGYKDHLFDESGRETCEPVFSREYLKDVATSMWSLSARIFGHEMLSYETLASALGEPNVTKVKRAVRRLDVLTRPDGPNEEMQRTPAPGFSGPALWAGNAGWRWRVERAEPGTEFRSAKEEWVHRRVDQGVHES